MDTLMQDLKFALRQLRRSPGFATVVVLTLALGIGANSAIFSLVRGVLLKPLPYSNGPRLVRFATGETAEGDDAYFSIPEMRDYARQSDALAGVFEYHSMAFTLLGGEAPDRVQTAVVSSNFFDELGVRPVLGRTFRADDDQPGADHVMVLSDQYWQRRFHGDPSVVGQTLRMNDQPIRVVGVLPPLPTYPGDDDVYIPTEGCPVRSRESTAENRKLRMVRLFGVLKQGVSREQATADLRTVSARMHEEYPEAYAQSDRSALSLVPVRQELTGTFRSTLILLMGSVALVLLIACANIANLMLVRILRREREVVVRAALGADRWRLARQLLTESLVLSLLGGLVGLGLAAAGLKLLIAFAGRFTALAMEVSLDYRVLVFTAAVATAAGFLFGIVPAIQAARQDLGIGLKEGAQKTTASRGRNWIRKGLVVAQVATAFVLLVVTGLMVRSLIELQRVDPGFDTENVLSMTISLPFSKYRERGQYMAFWDQLRERVGGLPSVRSVALASDVPLAGEVRTPEFAIEGTELAASDGPQPRAGIHVVDSNYFETLGIPLLAGRSIEPTDGEDSVPVVVVNQALVDRYWGKGDPIGGRLNLSAYSTTWWTVVGIVGNANQTGIATEAGPAIYFPLEQIPGTSMQVMVRTAGDPLTVLPDVRNIVDDLDADQPIADVRTLDALRNASIAPQRLTTFLLSGFAVLAFAISAVGLSGVLAFSLSQRRQEIGIRAALGAEPGELFRLMLRQGLLLGAGGLAVGAILAVGVVNTVSGLLFRTDPLDALTFSSIAALLLLVVFAASAIPARRAARIAPTVALKAD